MRSACRHTRSQCGSILFMILLAVALFGALYVAVTGSDRGNKDASSENIGNVASQIIQYSTNVEQTVSRLLLSNGCTDRQISFENTFVSGYTNASSPSDGRCHVFSATGGGMEWQTMPTASGGTDYFFTPTIVTGTGNDGNADLVMIAPNVSQEICQAINSSVEGTSWTTSNYREDSLLNLTTSKFIGAYATSNADIDRSWWSRKYGSRSGCRQNTSSGVYYYFHVLIAR